MMVDLGFLAILGISTWLGYSRGALIDLFVTFVFFGAVLGGLIFGPSIGNLIFATGEDGPSPWSMPVGFLIFFVVIYLIGGVIRSMIFKSVERSGMAQSDRMIGLVLGLARGGLIVLIVIACAVKWYDNPQVVTESRTYQFLQPFHEDVSSFVDFVSAR